MDRVHLVSPWGSARARAIPYRNRVEAFMHAIDTAMAELNSANRMITQASPQYCWPSTNAGSCDEPANEDR